MVIYMNYIETIKRIPSKMFKAESKIPHTNDETNEELLCWANTVADAIKIHRAHQKSLKIVSAE